ncbi:MAG: hypothetical protein JXR80_05755, partial [Deltaproteobacteria bacterium]|nr:hypothetical protein [Deltaproteobacteria bacterium]
VAVALYPRQSKMKFVYWVPASGTWMTTDYYDIAGGFASFGMHFTATAVILRLNGSDTDLSRQGSFSPASAVNRFWLAASGVGFQGSFDNVCVRLDDGITETPAYDNFSYVPYLSNDAASGRWTGLALTNRNTNANQVLVEYYSRAGSLLALEEKELAANGQTAFPAQLPAGSEGWIKVSSTEPLQGLALVGQSSPESMFDMDLKTELFTQLKLPHLAANSSSWSSMLMLCNPNSSAAAITLKAYNGSGVNYATKQDVQVPAYGSLQENLFTLFSGQELSGTMLIESTQPITAFLLYDSQETTWRAGLSAVPVQ